MGGVDLGFGCQDFGKPGMLAMCRMIASGALRQCSPMWHIPCFPISMLVLICIFHNLYLLLLLLLLYLLVS